jgi:large subunit ribosomal protein L10
MSKYVKDLVTQDLRQRLQGVNDVLLVSVAGLDANRNYQLRRELRAKKINLLVVKNSLAKRATEGTVLAPGFEGLEGLTAIAWGGEDIVALAKEISRLSRDKQFARFESRGGVLEGSRISAAQAEQVSKWPTREEQLSLLVGQILGPGAQLASQLTSAGGALASQIKQRGEESQTETPAESSGEAPAAS